MVEYGESFLIALVTDFVPKVVNILEHSYHLEYVEYETSRIYVALKTALEKMDGVARGKSLLSLFDLYPELENKTCLLLNKLGEFF